VNASINAKFSEPMDGTTITPETFSLADSNGKSVVGTVTMDGDSATFHPSALLAGLTTHTATVTTGVKDLAGNAMAAPRTWTFTTAVAPDTTPPSVISTSPSSGSTCIGIDSTITATFNEDVKRSTVTGSTFTLRDSAQNSVSGSVSALTTKSFALAPFSSLSYSTTYTVTLGSGIQDLAGNATPANYSWSFTTTPPGIGKWQATSTTSASSAIDQHTAVWTGTEMIVWGGRVTPPGQSAFAVGTGARYNALTDAWVSTSDAGAPSPRWGHVAVWNGSEMIVWGGTDGGHYFNDGARYDPRTDTWRPLSTVGAPTSRSGATAVWSGAEMLVWGGNKTWSDTSDDGRYNPASDSWQPISMIGSPSGRSLHTTVWTGTKMIVWGGMNFVSCTSTGDECVSSGGVYDPFTDSWDSVSEIGAPSGRISHTAVWTGREMAIWGGQGLFSSVNTGALYDPLSRIWRAMSTSCAPSHRSGHTAVWTGAEMIVWGGMGVDSSHGIFRTYRTGARYNAATDLWQQVAIGGPSGQTAIWTGAHMIVWGGSDNAAKYQP